MTDRSGKHVFPCRRLSGTIRYLHKRVLCAIARNFMGARMEYKTTLLDQMRQVLRLTHLSIRTEEA